MASKEKTKGNKAERKVAGLLTEWWGGEFRRMPNSGALRWNGAFWTYGDIVPPEDFPAVAEVKHHRHIDFQPVITGTPQKDNILGFWNQVCEDARSCYRETGVYVEPMLIAKKDFVPEYIGMRLEFLAGLQLNVRALYIVRPDLISFGILSLGDFLTIVSKQDFLQRIESLRDSNGSFPPLPGD